MGSPQTTPSTPILLSPSCQNCHGILDCEACFCGHAICRHCIDFFCPKCLKQHKRLPNESYTLAVYTGLYSIVGSFFELALEFLGGFCCSLNVIKSGRNCRLQCTFGAVVFNVCLFKDRKSYDATPMFMTSTPCNQFIVTVVFPTLQAPKFSGSLCSYRLNVELHSSTLDRPEVGKLQLLPETFYGFLEQIYNCPRQHYKLWEFEAAFPKYGRFLFASANATVYCLQCDKAYDTIQLLKEGCLGNVASLNTLYQAKPVIVIYEPELNIITDGATIGRGITSFATYLERSKSLIRPITSNIFLSAIANVVFKTPEIELCVAKQVNRILNHDAAVARIEKFIVYNLRVDPSNLCVIAASVWLCRPISQHLPTEISIATELGKFETILFQSLHRTIIKEGEARSWKSGTLAYWRGLHASTAKRS